MRRPELSRLACPGLSLMRMVGVGVVLYCSSLWAGPAAWYKWHSADNDYDICSQTSPGETWVAVKGPYEDALCRKLGVPH